MLYSKSQISIVLILVINLVLSITWIAYIFELGSNPISINGALITTAIFAAVLLIFFRLTIVVTQSELKIIFGIGLIRFTYRIDNIAALEVTKIPWYYGLGIRITPKGMLFNVQGLQVLQITLNTNSKKKTIMVGSANPNELKEALKQSLQI